MITSGHRTISGKNSWEILENDKNLDTATWLKYEKQGRLTVATLKCSVCIRKPPTKPANEQSESDSQSGTVSIDLEAWEEFLAEEESES